MEFLLVIGLIILLSFIVGSLSPKPGKSSNSISEKLIIAKKACPPHQWFWQEIVDQDNNPQGHRIVCKVCGPLAPQSGRD